MRKKYFIVGTGRCGTSMLASLIEKAGGEFSTVRRKAKSDRSGYFESDNLIKAIKWYRRFNYFKDPFPHKLRIFCRKKADFYLKKDLVKADWHKCPHFHEFIHSIKRLSYSPIVIGAWRDFWPTAISLHKKNGASLSVEMNRWVTVNRNLMLLLDIYPGCLVKFEHLLDLNNTIWAKEINRISNLHEKDLLKARENVVDKRTHVPSKKELKFLPEEIKTLQEILLEKTMGNY